MKKHIGLIFAVVLGYSQLALAQSSLGIDVKLSPAGTFKAETKKIKGAAYKTENGVAAENVLIDMPSLNTGISLRDKHLKERLEVTKYPVAKLIKAQGQNGEGTATIEVKGKKKNVAGTYKIKGNNLEAKFKMKLSDISIEDVRYMGVGVKDEVDVTIVLPLKANRSAASVKKGRR